MAVPLSVAYVVLFFRFETVHETKLTNQGFATPGWQCRSSVTTPIIRVRFHGPGSFKFIVNHDCGT